MIYYALFFVIVFVVNKRQTRLGKGNENSRKAAIVIGVAILLLMGLRDQTVAGDTLAYVESFQYRKIHLGSFADFLTRKEKLFYLTEFLCQKLTNNYTVYLFVVAIPVAVGFTILMKEYSDDMFLSVLLFCGVGTMYFCMAGLRQAMAIGFTMIAFPYAKKRKLIPFLLWCLVAYEFHNSAIVFVFVYLFINWKPDWKMWIAVVVCVFLGLTRNPIVMEIASFFFTKEYTMDEEGLNYTLFFIQLIFVVFCFVYNYFAKNKQEDYDNSDSLLMLAFIGLCFQAFTPIKGEFFRVSSYFSIYLCLEVPQTLSKITKKQDSYLIKTIMDFGLLTYIFVFGNARSYMTCF